jgi:hypothetical protein
VNTPINQANKPFSANIHNRAPRADFQYFSRGFTNGSPMTVPPILFYIPRQMVRRKLWFQWAFADITQISNTTVDVMVSMVNVRNPSTNRKFPFQWRTTLAAANKTLRLGEGCGATLPYPTVLVTQHENEVICFKNKVVQSLVHFPDGHALTVSPNHVIGEYDYVTLEINTQATNAASYQQVFVACYSEELIESR